MVEVAVHEVTVGAKVPYVGVIIALPSRKETGLCHLLSTWRSDDFLGISSGRFIRMQHNLGRPPPPPREIGALLVAVGWIPALELVGVVVFAIQLLKPKPWLNMYRVTYRGRHVLNPQFFVEAQ